MKRIIIFTLLLVVASSMLQAASHKKLFTFEGRKATLVIPDKPLDGNPWIWRATFPDWHTTVDSMLIAKGYHVAYVDTKDMFGSPRAMDIWDRFYSHLTTSYKLADKVVLEGVSRGGLYIHNWAKRNPEKVACIYAECPVCDFRTWPRRISLCDWQLLIKEYGFKSEAEAMAYGDNPIDNIEKLAKAKVPILYAISMSDAIVPPHENSLIFARRYIDLGAPVTIIPMDRCFNVENMKGHHFHIDNPEQIAAFIYQHSYPVHAL